MQRQELTLFRAGYCAADAGVAFDFRQPEPWRQGWMLWSEYQIANAVHALSSTASASRSHD